MVDLNAYVDDVPLAYLDVETTGLSPRWGDRICEIAVLRCQGGEIVDALQQLVNPRRRMSPGAFAVHGITEGMLCEAPLFPQVADKVLSLLDGAVFVGHNAPFDLGFLAEELRRMSVQMPHYVALDTLRLAQRHYRFVSYSLGRLTQALGLEVAGRAHRAMVDVLRTRAVFGRLVDDLWPLGTRSVSDYVKAQGGELRFARGPTVDVPALIQEALRGNRLLYLLYLSDQGEKTERLVRPLAVTGSGGEVLLQAHCLLRDAQRSFRIDRILDMDLVVTFE